MACENCCSSRSDLVDKILEQGQRLRNAMVQSILNNDPFNTDVVRDTREPLKLEHVSRETSEKITAFLQGDQMERRDELEALETLRSMSASDLCKTTDRTYRSDRSSKSDKAVRDRDKNSNNGLLKYVDSLKITVQSLFLNEAGRKKVAESLDDRKSVTQTYFLEYHLPDVLQNTQRTSKSKVDTGLDSNRNVRMCARASYHRVPIPFKQVSIHDILNSPDLDGLELKFRISFRGPRQKQASLLGHASFRFGSLEMAQNLSSSQELSVKLNESTPLVVGSLKISVQLGCGRLYFGREFVEAMCNKRENEILESPTDWIPQKLKREKEEAAKPICCLPEVPKQVLFGFIYISEARFSRELQNSYLTCQSFGQDDRFYSRVVEFDANPAYNFCQQVPLIHEEELLAKLRDNFMVVEFYEKENNNDFVVGLTKLPLHQFYLAYRNQVVVKYLSEKKYPTISCDGWEPILSPFDGDVVGQVQALLALGTKEQIETLELDRGFKDAIVRAKPNLPPVPPSPSLPGRDTSKTKLHPGTPRKDTKTKQEAVAVKKKHLTTEIASHISIAVHNEPVVVVPTTAPSVDIATQADFDTATSSPRRKSKNNSRQQHSPKSVRFEHKVDVGIQCEKMEEQNDQNRTFKRQQGQQQRQQQQQHRQRQQQHRRRQQQQQQQQMPQRWQHLNQLELLQQQQQQQLQQQWEQQQSIGDTKSIDDLLLRLMEPPVLPPNKPSARSSDFGLVNNAADDRNAYPAEESKANKEGPPSTTFKARVEIERALHLPFRKKHKGRTFIDEEKVEQEKRESMPWTYVTFEKDNKEVVATPVCETPVYNFKCKVDMCRNLLKGQPMLFKVWRKPAVLLDEPTNTRPRPNPVTDEVIGFASVDLTALERFFPEIAGWYHIKDFSGKIQGQLHVRVSDAYRESDLDDSESQQEFGAESLNNVKPTSPPVTDEPCELLGHSLKRKFTELDEITQRLRSRLAKVTDDDDDVLDDDAEDEFLRDINTLCVEDDYDTLSFEGEASALENRNPTDGPCAYYSPDGHNNETGPAEKRCLLESKQKIDTLLEKLSLISGDGGGDSNSRYVSGCSTGMDAWNLLEDLDRHSRPNLYHSVPTFDAAMRQKFGDSVVSDSYTDFGDDCRKAPEGEGNAGGGDASQSKKTE